MHLPDGILSPPVIIGGFAITALGVGATARRLDEYSIPRVGMLAAALFAASAVHIPLGPTSVHLTLTGLAGLLLGPLVFPAAAIALALQAVLFHHGGLLACGTNTAAAGVAGMACGVAFRRLVTRDGWQGLAAAFMAGAGAVIVQATIVAAALLASGRPFAIGVGVLLAQLPLVVIEGIICVATIRFLRVARPQMLAGGNRQLEHAIS